MWVSSYFGGGDFDIDDDGSQRGFEELCWVVDGICIQDNQLKRLGQLKDSLYFTLDLSWKHPNNNSESLEKLR